MTANISTNFSHIPVLLEETINGILPNQILIDALKRDKNNQIYIVDATIGGAGHAAYLVEEFHKRTMYKNFFLNLIGIDQDIHAINAATQKLDTLKNLYSRFNYNLFHANFSELGDILGVTLPRDDTLPDVKIHGLYADFGVSSPQLDSKERGFSILHEGPLDMRMNTEQPLTAEKILLSYSESELARIFFEYGEEPKAKLLSRAIVADRKKSKLPLENTKIFANYIKKILNYGYSRSHPAIRIFQALRIEVNDELSSTQTLLNTVPDIIYPFAKAVFLSFHSLEDRLVKRTMRLWQMKGMGKENPRGGIIRLSNEIKRNPRAHSARLRIFDFYGIIHVSMVKQD